MLATWPDIYPELRHCPYGTVSSLAHNTFPNTLSGVALGTPFATVKT